MAGHDVYSDEPSVGTIAKGYKLTHAEALRFAAACLATINDFDDPTTTKAYRALLAQAKAVTHLSAVDPGGVGPAAKDER